MIHGKFITGGYFTTNTTWESKYLLWEIIKRFPTPKEMSIISKKEILSLWSGLGYNSRALRLLEASKNSIKKNLLTQFIQILKCFQE